MARHNGHGITLVLSDRKDHCQELARILKTNNGITAEVLTGSTKPADRERILQAVQNGDCHYLVATAQLVGEGFDLPGISVLALATPVKFSGRVIQYMGRALRPAPGKESAVVLDFVDKRNPIFKASARSRAYTYQREGCSQQVLPMTEC